MVENIKQCGADSFDDEVVKSSMPVAVYFYSEDCLPCLSFTQIFDRMAAALNDRIKFVKVFRPHNRELSEKYTVKSSPTVMFFKGGKEVCSRLTGYIDSHEFKQALERVLEKSCSPEKRTIVRCDVLIIGAGPSGLTAAIYTARSRLHTVVVESNLPGGQVATTFHVANYPGTNGVIRGMDLAENMRKQALDFGAQIDDMQQISEIRLDGAEKYVRTDGGEYHARSVIIATGAQPRKLPAEGEREFRGRGVHYCATCDGALYQDADVLVVGGGMSAVDEAVFLSRYAKSIKIINRSDRFKAAQSSVDEALKNPSISVLWNKEVIRLNGEDFLRSVTLRDTKTGGEEELKTDGVFVYIGMLPNSGLFKGRLRLTESGYIPTDEKLSTNVPGVFAAGDIRDKEIRQIATAIGDGAVAGIMAERYLNRK